MLCNVKGRNVLWTHYYFFIIIIFLNHNTLETEFTWYTSLVKILTLGLELLKSYLNFSHWITGITCSKQSKQLFISQKHSGVFSGICQTINYLFSELLFG